MPQIRNVSSESRDVPWEGRTVPAGEVLTVPDADVYAYTQQDGLWEPADEAAQSAHDRAVAVLERPDRPRGNASREEWMAYVVQHNLATEGDITDLSRDELRDTYGQEG